MSSTEAMIKLKSSDGEVFEVEKAVAAKSRTLKEIMNAVCDDEPIPLPNVTWKIAEKLFEYCKRHVEAETKVTGELTAALEEFDAEFVKVDQSTLIGIIMAAHYLDIESLLDLTCKTVANMMNKKTPEEIRKTFNIKNDYTPDEEEKIRKEYEWALK